MFILLDEPQKERAIFQSYDESRAEAPLFTLVFFFFSDLTGVLSREDSLTVRIRCNSMCFSSSLGCYFKYSVLISFLIGLK